MSDVKTALPTDTWVKATWEEYLWQVEQPNYENAKGYYLDGWMRTEMLPVGFDHSRDHGTLALGVALFCILRGIPLTILDNCSFRKVGKREFQPDLSYYIGDRARLIPTGTNIVNLDRYPPPDLAIEIGKTTIVDDRTTKRTLYEEAGVKEYWAVDVENLSIYAFEMIDRGSRRIDRSQLLPGLAMSSLEEALQQSRSVDQSQVGAWLMQQFQPLP
ncbi:MAG: Uma2 family endonuclease [Drouetiella hepatica Uher 2000/2452]|jgi:Uma2 family endonuclease|uniref:Uma2 family endonuclease n=1 Tax=Drouetiella hepatica Uher 2000/2452 TaxID=904376 RepID=A0A951QG06_9CYAN|nr:Uma2 family endonuclease [Drouetiella hepatica Uher 2000/2452]